MKILVTGGAGFIGSHVVDALLQKGHRVSVLDDLSSGRKENLPPGVELTAEDIRSPVARDLVLRGSFDAIFHLAAQISVVRSVREPELDADINVSGSVGLMNAAAESGVKRFVFSSTGGAIYGDQDSYPADETHACRPESAYGTAKYCVEQYLDLFGRMRGLSWTALRYSNVFGPRQDPHGEAGVVAIFCRRLLADKPVTIFGDGEQTRDFVYVGDVARANVAALEREFTGCVNIGTGVETSVNRLYEILAQAARSSATPTYEPARPGELERSCLSASLARDRLGWEPGVTIEDGLARTLEWFRQE